MSYNTNITQICWSSAKQKTISLSHQKVTCSHHNTTEIMHTQNKFVIFNNNKGITLDGYKVKSNFTLL